MNSLRSIDRWDKKKKSEKEGTGKVFGSVWTFCILHFVPCICGWVEQAWLHVNSFLSLCVCVSGVC